MAMTPPPALHVAPTNPPSRDDPVNFPERGDEMMDYIVNGLCPDMQALVAWSDVTSDEVYADRVQTGADRVQTGLDRDQTGADRVQTGLDRVQTGLDVSVSSSNSGAASQSAAIASASSTVASTKASEAVAARDAAIAASQVATAPTENLSALAKSIHFGAIVDVALGDVSKDSDPLWVKRCADKSWYKEAATVGCADYIGWMPANASAANAWPIALTVDSPEKLANTTFVNTDGWLSTYGTLSVENRTLKLTSQGTNSNAYTTFSAVAGETYVIKFDNLGGTVASTRIMVGSSAANGDLIVGSFLSTSQSLVYTAASTATRYITLQHQVGVAGNYTYFTNVSVKKVAASSLQAVANNYFGNKSDGKFYKLGASSPTVTEVFRGKDAEFPQKPLAVAEIGRVVVYDADTGAMWMVFSNAAGFLGSTGTASFSVSSLTSTNGKLCIVENGSVGGGVRWADFADDSLSVINAVGKYSYSTNIANRNVDGVAILVASTSIASRIVNDISTTVLPSAPIDQQTGLAIPTVLVATAAGLSWITDSGVVWDSSLTSAFISCDIKPNGMSVAATTAAVYVYNTLPTADGKVASMTFGAATIPAISGTVDSVSWAGDDIMVATSTGLFRIQYNAYAPAKSMVSQTTNTTSTGWKVGDTRGAWLSDTTPETVVGGPALDPATLFASGEQGLWLDPSEFTEYAASRVDSYGHLPGVVGSYFSTPDSVANSITGDIDIRVKVAMDSWTPGGSGNWLIAKRASETQISYSLTLNPTGVLFFRSSVDGTVNSNAGVASSEACPFANGTVGWVRATRAYATGTVNFYTSTDGIVWVALGLPQTTTPNLIYNSTSIVEVGSYSTGQAPVAGKVYRAQIFNVINGTVPVVDFNPAQWGSGTSWTSSSGEAWTMNGLASVVPCAYTPMEHARLPGVVGSYYSTPDSVANSITGDIDIRVKVALDDWTPATEQYIISKFDTNNVNRTYYVLVTTTGAISFNTSTLGTDLGIGEVSTMPVVAENGAAIWIRATLDVNDGLGNRVYNFYTSTDGNTWTQLGNTVTVVGVTSIVNSNSTVQVGGRLNAAAGHLMSGKVYRARIYSGINGTLAVDFNPASGWASSWVSATGEVWTQNGSASLVGATPLRTLTPMLFQDSAGVTPVTAIEQYVGLSLDKSKGFTSSEVFLVSNPTFVGTTGWSIASGASLSASANVLTVTTPGSDLYGAAMTPISVVAGVRYTFTVNVVEVGANSYFCDIRIATNAEGSALVAYTYFNTTGDVSVTFNASATGTWYLGLRGGSNNASPNTMKFSNVRSYVIAGNHAYQSTGASRPVLSARKNWLLATETLATQNVTVLAGQMVLSFYGTGTVTLSGTSTAGPLVGTGASDRVSLTFTPTAGTLTLTVSGSVTQAQLEYVA